MSNPFTKHFEMRVRDSLVLYSQQLNVFITLIVLPYIISTNGGVVGDIVNILPQPYRTFLSPLIGFGAFWIVTWARLKAQGTKDENQ